MDVKYQSRVREMTADGETSTVTYYGSREEMETLYRAHYPNEAGEDGRLKTLRLYQASGDVWEVELRYERHQGGVSAKAPDTSFGRKSAQLQGGMLNVALEIKSNYKANWNHYLAASPKVGSNTAPAWWATATDTVLDLAQSAQYRWVKSPGECPVDSDGKWRIIKEKTKKSENFDVATYSITESARFGSAAAAGRMVADYLNRIGSPSETFGITGGDWKCDNATVAWTGKYWLATLTWTRSGDDQGWDRDLYG